VSEGSSREWHYFVVESLPPVSAHIQQLKEVIDRATAWGWFGAGEPQKILNILFGWRRQINRHLDDFVEKLSIQRFFFERARYYFGIKTKQKNGVAETSRESNQLEECKDFLGVKSVDVVN
jgi:hypothetical protein